MAAVGLVLCAGSRALAQPLPVQGDRWLLDASVALQMTSRTFDDGSRPVIYDETASVVTTHRLDRAPIKMSVGGGVRLAGDFSAGVNYTQYAAPDAATIAARVPHPTQFNQARPLTATPEGLERVESAIHLMAQWTIPVGDRLEVTPFAGPSFVKVSQDLVTSLAIAPEMPPYPPPMIAKTTIDRHTARAIGFNMGADVAYFVLPAVGVGVTVRLTKASVSLQRSGGTLDVDAGGLQIAIGARMRLP